MLSKPHRTNSKFQLRYFLVGDTKTADGAWALMYGQKIDSEVKVAHIEVQRLRRESKIAAIMETLATPGISKSDELNAQADLLESNAGIHVWELNAQAAKEELADIVELMEEIEPHRKYGHLPLLEALEAGQQEEWLLELKCRVENFIVANGAIPADELRFMRNHPQFESVLIPHIQAVTQNMLTIKTATEGLNLLSKPTYSYLLSDSDKNKE